MMKEMYKGMVNSPQTKITQSINSAVTDIPIENASVFPAGPNLAVIGVDQNAETIKYSSINQNILVGCTRGFQGIAKSWEAGATISRNVTEADLSAVQENIKELEKIINNNRSTWEKDTVTTVNGKTGKISKDDIIALGIPSQDTTYSAATEYDDGLMSSADKQSLDKLDKIGYGDHGQVLTTDKLQGEQRIWRDVNSLISGATNSKDGLMSSQDKEKLDSIEIDKLAKLQDDGKISINKLPDFLNGLDKKIANHHKSFIIGASWASIMIFVKKENGTTERYDLPCVTTSDAGLMSPLDKQKLDELTNISIKVLTQVQYDALSDTEKNRSNRIYAISG